MLHQPLYRSQSQCIIDHSILHSSPTIISVHTSQLTYMYIYIHTYTHTPSLSNRYTHACTYIGISPHLHIITPSYHHHTITPSPHHHHTTITSSHIHTITSSHIHTITSPSLHHHTITPSHHYIITPPHHHPPARGYRCGVGLSHRSLPAPVALISDLMKSSEEFVRILKQTEHEMENK